MFTHFYDMHSGGKQKEKYAHIYIEAARDEAEVIFYNRFGHNPQRVTCTCCGEDYSINSGMSLRQLSGYHRNCRYDAKLKKYVERRDNETDRFCKTKAEKLAERKREPHIPLPEYVKQNDVLVIYAKDIKAEERVGEVPVSGYVWMD